MSEKKKAPRRVSQAAKRLINVGSDGYAKSRLSSTRTAGGCNMITSENVTPPMTERDKAFDECIATLEERKNVIRSARPPSYISMTSRYEADVRVEIGTINECIRKIKQKRNQHEKQI